MNLLHNAWSQYVVHIELKGAFRIHVTHDEIMVTF